MDCLGTTGPVLPYGSAAPVLFWLSLSCAAGPWQIAAVIFCLFAFYPMACSEVSSSETVGAEATLISEEIPAKN